MTDEQTAVDPRDKLLKDAQDVFDKEMRVLLEAGTGVGKTKITLAIINDHIQHTGESWDIVVPNTKLISGWYDEIKKWGYQGLLKKVHIYCYQSIHKYNRVTNMVLDEGHKITDAKLQYIKAKTGGKSIIVLSASVTFEKRALLKELGIHNTNTVKYSLDRAVTNDLVTPYEINVIEHTMDNVSKYVPAGTKDQPFKVTEQKGYDYMTKKTRQAMASKNKNRIKYALLERMHYIYNLQSKLKAGKYLLSLFPDDKKVLIFCSSINQANAMCKYRYHSKTDDSAFKLFCEGKINRLAVVNSISEGVNIPELDYILMLQVQSNKVHLIQKLGRLLRKTSDPNKIGKVFILCTIMSQDSKWVQKALESFNKSRIKFLSYTNIQHQNALE
tara:strand:- start:8617 stop:9774 length:1158 start_codon:yes stop_codon:yes gene_type:complete